jgi:hypothetical protein
VEKRSFSLSNTLRRGILMWDVVFWTFVCLLNVLVRGGVWRWVWVAMLVITPAGYLWQYLSERSRCLELSDEGLELRSWPRRPVRFKWDAIKKIELFEKPSFWTVRPFLFIIAGDSRGRVVKVPVYPPSFEELAGIMKARLPDSIFAAR